jgi:endonuclease G
MKKIIFIVALGVVLFFLLSSYNNQKECYSYDEFNFSPIAEKGEVYFHENYSFCYLEDYEQSSWVAYKLDYNSFEYSYERKNDFREDEVVVTETSSPKDYYKSGYDRGHLAPAADMMHSELSLSESFFMSNISPQAPSFNRGVWKRIENKVRDVSEKKGCVYVTTGPVLNEFIDTIGVENKIPVPKYFYKTVLYIDGINCEMVAFLISNEKTDRDISEFVISVDSLEKVTNIDFYPALDDCREEEAESYTNKVFWEL